MLSSINFLFLTSLAVTSWIILCYFKQIEQQREEQLSVEINMGATFEESLKSTPCRDNYDIYLNFLCIFACVYALAKVTSFAENYVARHVHSRFGKGKQSGSMRTEPTTIEEYRAQQQSMVIQITYLEKENTRLGQEVKRLQQNNYLLMGKGLINTSVPPTVVTASDGMTAPCFGHSVSVGLSHSCTCAGAVKGVSAGSGVGDLGNSGGGGGGGSGGMHSQQNVYISNRHFHLTRQVYVNDGNVKMRFQDFNQEGDGITQIWQKYLEMQKYAIQKPATPQTSTEMANHVPIVISTEELQSMQGLF